MEAEIEQLRRRQDDQVQAHSELDRLREELRITQQQLGRKNSDHQLATNLTRENEARLKQLYEENHQISRTLSENEHQITVLTHEI
jgi:hypothetical protein